MLREEKNRIILNVHSNRSEEKAETRGYVRFKEKKKGNNRMSATNREP